MLQIYLHFKTGHHLHIDLTSPKIQSYLSVCSPFFKGDEDIASYMHALEKYSPKNHVNKYML